VSKALGCPLTQDEFHGRAYQPGEQKRCSSNRGRGAAAIKGIANGRHPAERGQWFCAPLGGVLRCAWKTSIGRICVLKAAPRLSMQVVSDQFFKEYEMGTDIGSGRVSNDNYLRVGGGGASINPRLAPAGPRPTLEPLPKDNQSAPESKLGNGMGGKRELNKLVLPDARGLLRRPDPVSVQKPPPPGPGKSDTTIGLYEQGKKGGAGSFPTKVKTTFPGGAEVSVNGTKAGEPPVKGITSVQGSVPVFGGAGKVVVGAGTKDGKQSTNVGAVIEQPVGRSWTLKVNTNASTPINGSKGSVTTGGGLTVPVGTSKVNLGVEGIDAQKPGDSNIEFKVGVSAPVGQNGKRAVEGEIGYKKYPADAKKDEYSLKLADTNGDNKSEVKVTTGANGTTVQGQYGKRF
jgi:hypothetical protein